MTDLVVLPDLKMGSQIEQVIHSMIKLRCVAFSNVYLQVRVTVQRIAYTFRSIDSSYYLERESQRLFKSMLR